MSELSPVLQVDDLPPDWRIRMSQYRFERDEVGQSSAGVFKLVGDGEPSLFLKCEPAGPFAELPDEAIRLRWLAGAGIACPKVVAQDVHDGQNWLLMTAVAGRDLSVASITPQQCIEIMATALRLLHAVDIRTCPFDHSLSNRLVLAKVRMEADEVDEDDFDDARLGQSAENLFRLLERQKPDGADLVVTHGDACLPNLLADDGRFSGFIVTRIWRSPIEAFAKILARHGRSRSSISTVSASRIAPSSIITSCWTSSSSRSFIPQPRLPDACCARHISGRSPHRPSAGSGGTASAAGRCYRCPGRQR
jgi:aminoglycoside 3'-phosphotransferase-2